MTLSDGSVVVFADTQPAQSSIDRYVAANTGRSITITTVQKLVQSQAGSYSSTGLPAYAHQARGGVLEFYAQGGLRGLTPMQPVAQMVPASTWRVVGDRADVPEAVHPTRRFAAVDGDPRGDDAAHGRVANDRRGHHGRGSHDRPGQADHDWPCPGLVDTL
ncbi:hypothetical protein [Rathayibacter rathayi]|uniref:hypothetical protein n=1 Tax=Rathayibacter rathayi TaxID=33887 RepID=UPI0011B09956|nr:hypothetical protein [Rathayibacter rathayi]